VPASEAPAKRQRGRPRKNPEAPVKTPPPTDGAPRRRGRPPKNASQSAAPAVVYDDLNAPEVQARLRDLIMLAKEQDYLTFEDLNGALPNGHVTVDLMDEIITRLRSMEIRIVDESEVDAINNEVGPRKRAPFGIGGMFNPIQYRPFSWTMKRLTDGGKGGSPLGKRSRSSGDCSPSPSPNGVSAGAPSNSGRK